MSYKNENPWRCISSKQILKNPWFYVRQDDVIKPDGESGQYNVIESKPAVFSVALSKKNEIYLVKVFRYPTGVFSIEVPAGSSENEDLLAAAKRELAEETGLIARTWVKLGVIYPAVGFLNQPNHIFLATNLKQTSNNRQAEEGIKETLVISLPKIMRLIAQGKITDAQTIAAITLTNLHLLKA